MVDWNEELIKACMRGDEKKVEMCLKHVPNLDGAMYYCSQSGWSDLVKSLLKKGAQSIYASFITACHHDQGNIALLLQCMLKDEQIDMGLIVGARANHINIVNMFIDKCSPAALESAYLWAIHHGNDTMIERLKEYGVMMNCIIDFE